MIGSIEQFQHLKHERSSTIRIQYGNFNYNALWIYGVCQFAPIKIYNMKTEPCLPISGFHDFPYIYIYICTYIYIHREREIRSQFQQEQLPISRMRCFPCSRLSMQAAVLAVMLRWLPLLACLLASGCNFGIGPDFRPKF